MEYYVYQVSISDEVVYVGKGKGSRYKHATSGKSHNFKLNKYYFEHLLLGKEQPRVDIVAWFEEEYQALKYEKFLISDLLPECNIRCKVEPEPLKEDVHEHEDVEKEDKVVEEVADDGDIYIEDIPYLYEDFKTYLEELYQCYVENSSAVQQFKFKWFVRQKRNLKKYQDHLELLDKLISDIELTEVIGVGGAPKSFRGIFNLCDAKYKYLQRYFKKRGETLKMYSADDENHLTMMKSILENKYGTI